MEYEKIFTEIFKKSHEEGNVSVERILRDLTRKELAQYYEFVDVNNNCKEIFGEYCFNLTEEFLNNVDWRQISTYQKLSEPFIEKFQNRVD